MLTLSIMHLSPAGMCARPTLDRCKTEELAVIPVRARTVGKAPLDNLGGNAVVVTMVATEAWQYLIDPDQSAAKLASEGSLNTLALAPWLRP